MKSDNPEQLKERIQELEKENEQLRESNNKFRTFYEHVPLPYHSLDTSGNIIDVNAAWLNTLGYKREEVTGKPFRNFLHKNFQFYFDTIFSEFKKRGYLHNVELRMKHKKGHYIDVLYEGNAEYEPDGSFQQTYCTFKDITQQKETEQKLRRKEEEARITLNSIGDAVISSDLEGKVVQMNNVAQELTGWNIEEAKGKPMEEVFHIVNAITGEKAESPVKQVLKSGETVGLANDTKLVAKDGTEYQIADSAAPIRDDQHRLFGVVAVFRDVTEAYRKNQQIKESKEFLDAVFNSIQDGVSVLNPDLTIRYVNPVMEKWYSENMPLVGRKCSKAYHNSSNPCDPCPSLRCMKTKKTESDVIPGVPDPDSPVKWLELYSYPIIDNDSGKVTGVVEFVRDITQREETKRELKRHKDLLAKSQEIAQVGSWELDLTQNRLIWSDEVYRIFGLEPQEFEATYEAFLNRVHSDDREAVSAAYEGSIREGHDHYEIEHRIIRKKNGEIRHVYEKCEHVRDETGQVIKSVGMVQDITAQRKSEEKYRQLFENAPVGISQTDLQGQPIMQNDTMAHLLGFESSEEMMKSYYEHGEQFNADPHRRREFLQKIKDQGYVKNFEYKMKRKDGSHVWLSLTANKMDSQDKTSVVIEGFAIDITDRKEAELKLQKKYEELESAEEELRTSNEELQEVNQKLKEQKDELEIYKRMVESSEDLMAVVDAGYNYISVNNAYLKYYQQKREEVIGSEAKKIIGEKYFEETVKPSLDKCLAGETVQFEMIREFPEFGKVNLDIIYYPLEINEEIKGVVSAIRDITERKVMEENLIKEKERAERNELITKQNLRNIRFLADSAINFVDDHYEEDIYRYIVGKIRELNPKASVVVLNKVDHVKHLLKTKAIELLDEDLNELLNEMGIQLLEQKYVYDDRLFALKDEEVKKVDISIHELTFETIPQDIASEIEEKLDLGNIYSITFVFDGKIYADAFILFSKGNDLENKETLETFVKQASLALKRRESEEELVIAKEKAEESDRLKSAFLANMSHEIRTPMNGIMGFSQMLQEKEFSKEKRDKYLDIIHSRTNHLLNIINDLVDVSKIEANQLTLNQQDFCLNDVLKELHRVYNNELKVKEKTHVQLKLNKALDDRNSYIYSDPSRFRQIMDNLLNNAIKFTHEGSVEFGYEFTPEDKLHLYVKDTGIGIPGDQQEHIFERFRQADDTTSRAYEGTGLGLTISKNLVKLMGGKMWMDSTEGEGSVFYFTLPYEGQQKTENKEMKEGEPDQAEGEGKTLLVIEDDLTSLEYMKELLEPSGFNIVSCTTGKEGYEAFLNHPEIDLILMDIKLPDTTGLELTRKIRSSADQSDVPIIAQTAYAMSEDARKSLDAGCDDYISKPIDISDLLRMINKHI